MIAPGPSRQRGVTLIEMLVVMTGLAVLLGICAVTIQLLIRLSTDAQAGRAGASALIRLAERFREDVHACDEARPRPSGELHLMRGPRAVVEYRSREGRVDRVERVEGRPEHHESFGLGRDLDAAFERRDDGPLRFVALVVRHRSKAGRPDPPRPLEVLALAGKDRPEPARAEKGGPSR